LTPFLIKRDGKQDGFPSKPDLKDRACFFGRLLSFKAFSFLYLKPAAFWMIGWSNGKVITVGNLSHRVICSKFYVFPVTLRLYHAA